ncbi:hypothetical protein ACO2Q8_04490 [Larkinella sp. VNQ87]|uniref:hypothetical protein n=1 Tax=Larkinella sp. VNQ87 TaxID=3400921 RepID=UPI003C01DF5A
MTLTEAEFDRIEAFLAGTLPPDEQRQLEADMNQDPDLRQAFEEHRVIWEGLHVPVAVAYFQDLHEQLEEQGLLDADDLWVEAEPADDEPEVFVADDSKADPDESAHHIEVAILAEPDPEVPPKAGEAPNEWDADLLHPYPEDSDEE